MGDLKIGVLWTFRLYLLLIYVLFNALILTVNSLPKKPSDSAAFLAAASSKPARESIEKFFWPNVFAANKLANTNTISFNFITFFICFVLTFYNSYIVL